MLCLSLLYCPTDGRPLRIANIDDPELLNRAVDRAVREAERRAAAISEVDEVLGAAEREEAGALRRVLGIFMGRSASPPGTVM